MFYMIYIHPSSQIHHHFKFSPTIMPKTILWFEATWVKIQQHDPSKLKQEQEFIIAAHTAVIRPMLSFFSLKSAKKLKTVSCLNSLKLLQLQIHFFKLLCTMLEDKYPDENLLNWDRDVLLLDMSTKPPTTKANPKAMLIRTSPSQKTTN